MDLVKQLLPPIVYTGLKRSALRKYGWFGDYASWAEAKANATGYDSDLILDKILKATLKVRAGEAAYEQDSVLFDKINYDWPVIAGLLWIAALNKGELNVLDFGGSLGRSYFQNKKFLDRLDKVHWNIVEQENFVKAGKKNLEDERLKFYLDIPACLKEQEPQVVLLSSVLPYLERPYEMLQVISATKIPNLIIDRLPLINSVNDRLTVQKVPPHIYSASYPAWFFSKKKFITYIEQYYDVLEEYDCNLQLNIRSEVKGLILKLKS
jgi:putative methyltransferase (TIGR04325 family)